MRPLLFLVADKNMEGALRGFFERDAWHLAACCAPFEVDPVRDIKVAAGKNDPGLYTQARDLLVPFRGTYRHAVVMVDAEWEGSPGPAVIEDRLVEHLQAAGWAPHEGLALVCEPEVDAWLWSTSPHSASALGWDSTESLRAALEAAGFSWDETGKPVRPKEAAQWALARKKIPRSSSIYKKVAFKTSVSRCHDTALQKLLAAIRRWFPA